MADQRFLSAFLTPAVTVILGKRLKPFCLRHRLFLEGIGSPFLQEQTELTAADLIVALKVCADERIDQPTLGDKWLNLKLTLSKPLLARGCAALIKHIDRADSYPKFWERKDRRSGAASTVPWELSVACNLMRNGVSYQDAFNMPEAKAFWLSATFSIQQGSKLEFISTDDEALIDQLTQIDQTAKVEANPKPTP
jgi:hypothetical protein